MDKEWKNDVDKMQELLSKRKNRYLTLAETVCLTTTYEDIQQADYIIISVDAQKLQEVVVQLADYDVCEKTVILCMKGIEIETGAQIISGCIGCFES